MIIEEKQLKAIEEIKKFHPISSDEINKLESFVELLLQHNKKFNLIGKSTIEEVWNRHILDSAQLLKYIPSKDLVIGDFGSGAGFPAIVLSILGVKEVHLIEKSFRKCEFLQEAAKISTGKIIIHQKRAEEINNLKFDIIASRAFAPLDKLILVTKPFVKEGSFGIFLKGKNFENEINIAQKDNGQNNGKNNNFEYKSHPSLTSNESKVLIINYK